MASRKRRQPRTALAHEIDRLVSLPLSERIEWLMGLPFKERIEWLDSLPREARTKWLMSLPLEERHDWLLSVSSIAHIEWLFSLRLEDRIIFWIKQQLFGRVKWAFPGVSERDRFALLVTEMVERVEGSEKRYANGDTLNDIVLSNEARVCIDAFKQRVIELMDIAGDNESVFKTFTCALMNAHTLGMLLQDMPHHHRDRTRTELPSEVRTKKSEERWRGRANELIDSEIQAFPNRQNKAIARAVFPKLSKEGEKSSVGFETLRKHIGDRRKQLAGTKKE